MISIIIPVWKTRYLRDAIDSVLAQTYPDFELIVVEGRRLGDFDSIMARYTDSRIQVKRHEVMPIIENWNRCMGYASGEFSILLCDDDMFAEDHLENLSKLAQEYPEVDVFHSRIQIVDDLGRLNSLSPTCPTFETASDFIYMKECYKRSQYVSDFMYRTSRFREKGGFVERPMAWFTDVDTAYSLAFPNGVAFSEKATFIYRNSEDNISSNLEPVQALEAVKIHYTYLEQLLDESFGADPEYRKLIRHHLPKWRDKEYAAAYTRTGIGRFPFAPLFYAGRYRKTYPVSLGRALLASVFAMVQKLNQPGI